MWLISTRFFQLGLHQNQLAVGWQLSSHRVQSDCTFQAGHPLVIKSKQVLINDSGQAIELRHLQCIITHVDDVTVWFQEVDPQDKGFREGVCLGKPEGRTEQRQHYWCAGSSLYLGTKLAWSLKIVFHTICVSGRDWILLYTLHPTSLFFSHLLKSVSTPFSVTSLSNDPPFNTFSEIYHQQGDLMTALSSESHLWYVCSLRVSCISSLYTDF